MEEQASKQMTGEMVSILVVVIAVICSLTVITTVRAADDSAVDRPTVSMQPAEPRNISEVVQKETLPVDPTALHRDYMEFLAGKKSDDVEARLLYNRTSTQPIADG